MTRHPLLVSPAACAAGRKPGPAPLLAALAVLLFALCPWAMASEARDPDAYFFTQTFGDLREEAEVARDEGKLGLLLFYQADSCPYCQKMLREVFSKPVVQDWYGKRFTSIAVDIHGDVELTDFDGISLPSKVFSEHRQVFLTPVIAFLDFKGNEMYRHLGMVRSPAEMLLLGEYIEGKHYFDTEFRTFAKSRGMQRDGILMTPGEETE
jgi:thioredoxin-related protein